LRLFVGFVKKNVKQLTEMIFSLLLSLLFALRLDCLGDVELWWVFVSFYAVLVGIIAFLRVHG